MMMMYKSFCDVYVSDYVSIMNCYMNTDEQEIPPTYAICS